MTTASDYLTGKTSPGSGEVVEKAQGSSRVSTGPSLATQFFIALAASSLVEMYSRSLRPVVISVPVEVSLAS